MQQPSGGITPLDDVLRISGDTTVGRTAGVAPAVPGSPRRSPGPGSGPAGGPACRSETAADLLRQDLLCPCRGQGEPCLRDGGSTCPAIRRAAPAEVSVLGGRSPASPRVPGGLSAFGGSARYPAAAAGGLSAGGPAHPDEVSAHGRLRSARPAAGAPAAVCAALRTRPVAVQPDHPLDGADHQRPAGDLLCPARGDSRKWIALAHPTLASAGRRLLPAADGNHVVVFRDKPPRMFWPPMGPSWPALWPGRWKPTG